VGFLGVWGWGEGCGWDVGWRLGSEWCRLGRGGVFLWGGGVWGGWWVGVVFRSMVVGSKFFLRWLPRDHRLMVYLSDFGSLSPPLLPNPFLVEHPPLLSLDRACSPCPSFLPFTRLLTFPGSQPLSITFRFSSGLLF